MLGTKQKVNKTKTGHTCFCLLKYTIFIFDLKIGYDILFLYVYK
jgi:hypothetical protein